MTSLLSRLVREQLDPSLAEKGFRGDGATWNRRSGVFTQVIAAQAATYSTPGNETFTINLGLFWPRAFRIWPEKTIPRFVRETDCMVTVRLGSVANELSKNAIDTWWTIQEPFQIQAIGDEIVELVISKGLPFFQRFKSVRDIHDFVEIEASPLLVAPALRPLYLALLKAELGDMSGAREALEAGRASAGPEWVKRANLVAQEIGLDRNFM